MTALPPDLREDIRLIRNGMGTHDLKRRAAVARVEQRLMEYERVVEAAQRLLVETDEDPECVEFPIHAWVALVEANHALDSQKAKP